MTPAWRELTIASYPLRCRLVNSCRKPGTEITNPLNDDARTIDEKVADRSQSEAESVAVFEGYSMAEAEAFDQLCLDVTARYTAACAKFTYHSCPAAWSGFCTAYSELMAIMWIHCKFAPSICSRTACVAIQRAAVAQMSAVFETCDCRSLAELLEDQIVYSCQ